MRERVAALLRDPSTERLAAAVDALGDADAESATAMALRAELLRRRGRHDEAAPLFAASIARGPDIVPAYHCAALNAVARGDRDAARVFWLALLESNPDDVLARYQIALTYHEAGALADAADWYQRQLAHAPRTFKAAWNLGLVRQAQRDAAAAADAFQRAHALAPMDPRPLVHAADALGEAADLPAAIELLDRAIALEPANASLRWRAGAHLSSLALHEQAMVRMREAAGLDPNNAYGHSALLMEMQYDTRLATREAIAEAHREWGDRHARGVPRRDVRRRPRMASDRLRIGYVSPRFGQGPLASFFLPVLEAHDTRRLHVTLYSAHAQEDEVTARMRRAAAAWRDLPADDEEAAALIAADELDLLIDLAGHAPGHRLTVFARKPAPVQASWLDSFETTGVPAIDYFVGDRVHTPATEARHFRERLVLLPRSRFAYRGVVATPRTEASARTRGFVAFGSFNRHAKLTATVVALWRAVLEAVPDARLVLRASAYQSPRTVEWIRQQWAGAGMPVNRIDFHPYIPLTEAIAAYRDVDVALDPFPYNGGVTTCDALSMGVPVLALEGDRMIARQSAALLRAAGHPEWVARGDREYVTLAVEVAEQVVRGNLRAALIAEFPRSSLCDVAAFTRALEHAWTTLVELGPRDGRPVEPPLEIPG